MIGERAAERVTAEHLRRDAYLSLGSCGSTCWEGETGRNKLRTRIVDRGARAATDRVRRDLNPPAPDLRWCGDITYLHTGEGWLFLTTVSTCTPGGIRLVRRLPHAHQPDR